MYNLGAQGRTFMRTPNEDFIRSLALGGMLSEDLFQILIFDL